MIYIYTDTTVTNAHAVCTSFIITDTNYLGCITNVYDNVLGSIHGELLAILQGLKYVDSKSNAFKEKDITVFTDSKEAIQHITNATKTKHFVKLVNDIASIRGRYNVKLEYIRGHAIEHSPNKVVDLMSRSVNTVICNESKGGTMV